MCAVKVRNAKLRNYLNEIKREDLQNYIIDFPIILYIVTEYSINMHGHTIRASLYNIVIR
jgi:hypothetical protein